MRSRRFATTALGEHRVEPVGRARRAFPRRRRGRGSPAGRRRASGRRASRSRRGDSACVRPRSTDAAPARRNPARLRAPAGRARRGRRPSRRDDRVENARGVQGGDQREVAARGIREAGDRARRVGVGVPRDREHRAAGADRDDHVSVGSAPRPSAAPALSPAPGPTTIVFGRPTVRRRFRPGPSTFRTRRQRRRRRAAAPRAEQVEVVLVRDGVK